MAKSDSKEALILLRQCSYALGSAPLLDQVDMRLARQERVALVGRNGAGKSTLLKILLGDIEIDSGKLVRRPGLRMAQLQQDLPPQRDERVDDFIASGCDASARDWERARIIEQLTCDLALEPAAKLADLSGGMQRRALLARALAAEPELLLLDEPTNHLDIDTIVFLENYLLAFRGCLLIISHDRAFLHKLATRVLELDRGSLKSWPGDFANFLRRRAADLSAEHTQNQLFDKKLANEEAWIRQGVKARRTRNEGRVRALEQLRVERQARRSLGGSAKMRLTEAEASGRQVLVAEGLSFAYAGKPIVKNLDLIIQRGDRIAIVGPNGIGKSTLINLLLQRLSPDSGRVQLGSKLQLAYFDQQRAELDPNQSVLENVGGGSDFIELGGKRIHIISYLRNFLFTPEVARGPISKLSGGERNRLLLARLFSQPANLLILDEPTNDLDVETLELLEEQLLEFAGTIIIVSHDRAFIDNVVTSCLICLGDGEVTEHIGSYSDYLLSASAVPTVNQARPSPSPTANSSSSNNRARKQLQKSITSVLRKIDKLEHSQQQLHEQMAAPEFYQQAPELIQPVQQKLQQVEQELADNYVEWQQLEDQLSA